MKIAIIGAGPTGLGAAYRLNERRFEDWTVYEKNDYVGGLSASFRDGEGFTWDVGGHVLFSHFPYFTAAVENALHGEFYEHLRESWIRILGTWVPYPFQNNLRHLPPAALTECLDGLRTRSDDRTTSGNFHAWMTATFGSGIVKYFMQPYNEKVWAVPLEDMSASWIGERVSLVDIGRIERNIAEGRDDVSWGPNNRFRFPRRGGTGAIFNGLARPLRGRITFKRELLRVDPDKKVVIFADGLNIGYDILINTSPLDLFIESCVSIPPAVRAAADALVHNSGLIVGLGLSGTRRDHKCWMYFPEKNAPFYRTTNFFNYSPYNVPDGRTDRYFSLMCETACSPHRNADTSTIVEDTAQGLVNEGLLSKDERSHIHSRYLIDVPYSYPIPTLGRDEALNVIQPYLESRGVYSRGRFGAWKYEVGNMDHSFMQGVEVVDRILDGKQETIVGNWS